MMSAEQWYEYQESYRRYGVDLQPPKPEKVKRTKPQATVSPKDKVRLLLLTVFLGVLCVGVIITTAYAAQLKYDINRVIGENAVIEGEIQNLDVQLQRENNVATIEEKAMNELGMVYPYGSQVVYLKDAKEVTGDFALLLKDQAYN